MDSHKFDERREPEIVYSRSVKAGKRIYYLDVKKARNNDLYLCLTESKRKQAFEEELPQFEKHKLFLYKEDFSHFVEGLQDVIDYVKQQVGEIEDRQEWTPSAYDVEDSQQEGEVVSEEAQEEEKEESKEEKPRRSFFGLVGRKKN